MDNDCDGQVDAGQIHLDVDGDGYPGPLDRWGNVCEQAEGEGRSAVDPDDRDATRFPLELCLDGVDNDLDGIRSCILVEYEEAGWTCVSHFPLQRVATNLSPSQTDCSECDLQVELVVGRTPDISDDSECPAPFPVPLQFQLVDVGGEGGGTQVEAEAAPPSSSSYRLDWEGDDVVVERFPDSATFSVILGPEQSLEPGTFTWTLNVAFEDNEHPAEYYDQDEFDYGADGYSSESYSECW